MEHPVQFLETAAGGLGVEEPCNGYEDCIENSPDDVQAIAQVDNGSRRDIDDSKVGQPVESDSEGDAFIARALRHNFGGVHPANGEDAKWEDVKEEEGESHEGPKSLVNGTDFSLGGLDGSSRRKNQKEETKLISRETHWKSGNAEHGCYHHHAERACCRAGDKNFTAASSLDEEVGAGVD